MSIASHLASRLAGSLAHALGSRPRSALAPVSYAGATTVNGTASAAGVSIPIPAGASVGDYLLLIGKNSANEAVTFSTNGSLTSRGSVTLAAPTTMQSRVELFEITGAGPTHSVLSPTFVNGTFGCSVLVRGARSIEASTSRNSDANGTTPGFANPAALGAGRLAVAITLVRANSAPQPVDAAWTRARDYGSATGAGSRIVVDVLQAGAGAVAVPVHYGSALAVAWSSHALILAP